MPTSINPNMPNSQQTTNKKETVKKPEKNSRKNGETVPDPQLYGQKLIVINSDSNT